MGTTKDKMDYLFQTKVMIKDAIREKGVEVSLEDAFRRYPDLIRAIPSGKTANIKFTAKNPARPDDTLLSLLNKKNGGDTITFIDADGNIIKDGVEVKTNYTVKVPCIMVTKIDTDNDIYTKKSEKIEIYSKIPVVIVNAIIITEDDTLEYYVI